MPAERRAQNRRLDSWKEIAAFFGRDESTVKRWERDRALPVHRLPGSSRSRVFAYSDELTRWMQSRDGAEKASDQSATGATSDVHNDTDTVVVGSSPSLSRSFAVNARRWMAITASFVLLLAAASVWFAWRRPVAEAKSSDLLVRDSERSTTLPESSRPPANPEAQELYLKGRYYWTKRTPEDLNRAVDFFTQAIVKDPNYALAYVGLADSYNLLREFSAMPDKEAYPRALAAARKAVELDNSSAEAYASLAFSTFYWSWDAASAEREFRRAIQLNPNYIPAHHWYATSLLTMGRFPESLEQIERARQLDPASNPILADKAVILLNLGRREEAINLLKQIEESQPSFASTHNYLAFAYLDNGDYAASLAEATKAAEEENDQVQLSVLRSAEQGLRSGGKQGMLQNTLMMQKKYYREGSMSPYFVALTCARLGLNQDALHYLHISYAEHDSLFILARGQKAFDGLRSNPDFHNLMAESGMPPLP